MSFFATGERKGRIEGEKKEKRYGLIKIHPIARKKKKKRGKKRTAAESCRSGSRQGGEDKTGTGEGGKRKSPTLRRGLTQKHLQRTLLTLSAKKKKEGNRSRGETSGEKALDVFCHGKGGGKKNCLLSKLEGQRKEGRTPTLNSLNDKRKKTPTSVSFDL